MNNSMRKFLPAAILVALLGFGCAGKQDSPSTATKQAPAAAEQKAEANVLTGKIVGLSNKAKTVSIEVGQGDAAKTHMLKFDDKTTGIEHAVDDAAAIITVEMRGSQRYAVDIKPKLAKLPEGVTEIKVAEMEAVINAGTPIFLVDSRPTSRWDQSHLPGAVSIPVPKLKEQKAAALPKDKNQPLVFYCGGPT